MQRRWITLDFKNLWLVFSFVVAFVVAFATTPLVKVIAFKIGAVDIPKDERRIHKHPIPRLGGLAIYYGFIVSILSFGQINAAMRGILIGSLIIVILGVVDDVKQLGAKIKLVVQIIAALVVALHGVQITVLTNPNIFSVHETIQLGYWSIPLTIMWIVGITNAVNLIDGLDGLAAGVSSIASISLLFIALLGNEYGIALATAAVAGACLGFLPYNFNPAKIFMGDTGAMFLGYTFAAISVVGAVKSATVIALVVPILALGLPIMDTAFAILRRFVNGYPIMKPDKDHLHHRLLAIGLTQKQTVLIMYSISAVFGMSAIALAEMGLFQAGFILIALITLLVITGRQWGITDIRHSKQSDV
jgi:UDP-GlcNAc:undecaprenyl-phosphate GlcNAc-1-phosphate transferase